MDDQIQSQDEYEYNDKSFLARLVSEENAASILSD